MPSWKEKTKEDIKWETMEIDGQQETVCSVADGAVYMDMKTVDSLKLMLAKAERTVYAFDRQKRQAVVRKKDLDELQLIRTRPHAQQIATPSPRKEKKTLDDIKWIEMELDGEGVQTVCSIGDAAVYLDLGETATITGLTEHGIRRWKMGIGNKKYVKKSDLDKLRRGRPAE